MIVGKSSRTAVLTHLLIVRRRSFIEEEGVLAASLHLIMAALSDRTIAKVKVVHFRGSFLVFQKHLQREVVVC